MMLCSRRRTAFSAGRAFLCVATASTASWRMVASLVSRYFFDCLMAVTTASTAC